MTPALLVRVFLLIGTTAFTAVAKTERSAAEVSAFKRHNPCPATGARSGSCTGHVVDHIHPLCAGGHDQVSNMQWQTVKDAREKDKLERKMCRNK